MALFVTIYMSLMGIDDQKEAEKAKNEALLKERDEYEKLYQRIAGTLSDAVSSTQLNLTKNSYIKGYSEMPEVIKKLEKKTADEHFMAAISSVTDEKIKTEMIKQFNCANLIMLYNKGEKNVTKEYPVITSKGNIKWISTVVYLLKNSDP
jgi:glutamate mutase epsilon subunit